MRQRIILGVTLVLVSGVGARQASAASELFDWGFNLDGTTYCNVGPCDFDVIITGNLADPGALPGAVDTSGFDFFTGLGTLNITFDPGAPGNYEIDVFLDHAIDDLFNGFFNEFGTVNSFAPAGLTGEIDDPLFGDIFGNFTASTLDGANGVPAGFGSDVAMALGWDFTLGVGESAFLSFIVTEAAPGGFSLSHTDPDSNETIYFSSVLDIRQGGAPVPEPGSSMLIAAGLVGLAAYRRKRTLGRD